jgi:hypothetical protein
MTLTKCSVVECSREVVARGLCDLHYRRLLHHGKTENTRPADWGSREKHPLYESWRWMIRNRDPMCQEWKKDFWQFVKDVGERPSEKHRCFRLDEKLPYGPQNFFWREAVLGKESGEDEKEYRRRYMREWRQVNQEAARNIDLKKHYGVTLDQYNEMLAAQNGVCAICFGVNEVIDKRTGRVRNLAVDHCHAKGIVRKLLCQGCNQGLGNFKDDPRRLIAAANYLLGSDYTELNRFRELAKGMKAKVDIPEFRPNESIVRDGVSTAEVVKAVDDLLEHRASDPRLWRTT